jgi:hypothetical protein
LDPFISEYDLDEGRGRFDEPHGFALFEEFLKRRIYRKEMVE